MEDLQHFHLFNVATPFGLTYRCLNHGEFDFDLFCNTLVKQSESFVVLRMPGEVANMSEE